MQTADLLLFATASVALGVAVTGVLAYLLARRRRMGTTEKSRTLLRHHPVAVLYAVAVVTMLASLLALPPAWDLLRRVTNTGTPDTAVVGMVGGCEPFLIYAQNEWAPLGAVKRSGPSPTAHVLGQYDGNEPIAVDGWVHAIPAYPTNYPPFDSDIWFRVADGSGWVSFAGLRAAPTRPLTTPSEGGTKAAPAPEECQGAVRAPG